MLKINVLYISSLSHIYEFLASLNTDDVKLNKTVHFDVVLFRKLRFFMFYRKKEIILFRIRRKRVSLEKSLDPMNSNNDHKAFITDSHHQQKSGLV